MRPSQYNFKLKNEHKEKIKGKSQTVVGKAYTIKELLERHTRGYFPEDVYREAHYQEDANHESVDFQKIQRLDIVDKKQIIQNNQETINNLKQITIEQQIKNQKIEETTATTQLKDDEVSDAGATLGNQKTVVA